MPYPLPWPTSSSAGRSPLTTGGAQAACLSQHQSHDSTSGLLDLALAVWWYRTRGRGNGPVRRGSGDEWTFRVALGCCISTPNARSLIETPVWMMITTLGPTVWWSISTAAQPSFPVLVRCAVPLDVTASCSTSGAAYQSLDRGAHTLPCYGNQLARCRREILPLQWRERSSNLHLRGVCSRSVRHHARVSGAPSSALVAGHIGNGTIRATRT